MEQLQEQMKTANKIIRNKKTTEQEKVAQLQELGISETNAKELLNPDRFEGLGFASFSLQNNRACIRTAKLRLEKVIALKNAETKGVRDQRRKSSGKYRRKPFAVVFQRKNRPRKSDQN